MAKSKPGLRSVNPIENLWYDLKMAVHKWNTSNLKELEQFCLEEWANILVARCAKRIETYPKRLTAIIAAKRVSKKWTDPNQLEMGDMKGRTDPHGPGKLETIGDRVDATQDLLARSTFKGRSRVYCHTR
jgi:hypothetical protein